MRNLLRNQRKFWYCTYGGSSTIVDSDGHDTGEPCVTYLDPIEAHGNINAATGRAEQMQFGLGIEYDRVVQLPGTDWDIAEDSLLFIESVPPSVANSLDGGTFSFVGGSSADGNNDAYDGSVLFDGTNVLADHVVVRVAKSLNQTSLAIKQVRDG